MKTLTKWGRNQAGREISLFSLGGGSYSIREYEDNVGGYSVEVFDTLKEAEAEFSARAKTIRWAA